MEILRLDSAETIFFSRELETVDKKSYDVKFPLLEARMLLPKVQNVGQWDREYTYQQYETFGEAEFIADRTRDIPKVDIKGQEFTTRIKPIAVSYDYTIPEIRAANAHGKPLDAMKATAARRAIEQKIDKVLAFGSTVHNMKGFVNHSSVGAGTFTPVVKDGGSATEWDAAGADPDLILSDVHQIVSIVWTRLKEAEGINDKLVLVIPPSQYLTLAQNYVGDDANKTLLSFIMKENPLLEDIIPWHKLTGAGVGGTDRMICYVRDPQVVGALIPLEYSRQKEQLSGLTYEIPVLASCGGTVIRYPIAVEYGDGI